VVKGDTQICGFHLRFSLDIQFVFTATIEDYTNRGSIVTPLDSLIQKRTVEISRSFHFFL